MVWDIVWPQIIVFFAVIVYGSFFEWTLHRFIMHKRTIISYPFELHALLHHKIFKSDKSFHAQNDEMKEHVTFVPRDYFFLLMLNVPFFLLAELITGVPVIIGGSIATLMYVGAFDILHWAFHIPKSRFFERWGWFRFIKRHHLLHHKYQYRNLNVVLPIADLVIGTLVRRPKEDAVVLEV